MIHLKPHIKKTERLSAPIVDNFFWCMPLCWFVETGIKASSYILLVFKLLFIRLEATCTLSLRSPLIYCVPQNEIRIHNYFFSATRGKR